MGGGQGFTISKKKLSLSNFLDFLSCCVKFFSLVQRSLFFIPSESIVAMLHWSMILEEKHLRSGYV